MAEKYVIRRHGAFFRPNAAGYTHHIAAAGLYSKAEAESYLDVEGLTIHPLSDYIDTIKKEAADRSWEVESLNRLARMLEGRDVPQLVPAHLA